MKVIYKRLALLISFSMICMIVSNSTVAESFSEPLPERIPQSVVGYLQSDDCNTEIVKGELINLRCSSAPNHFAATYAYTVTLEHSNTVSGPDSGYSSTVFLTIEYITRNTYTEYLLTSVSGYWLISDDRVTVTDAELLYACSGANPLPVYQRDTVDVSNFFSQNTNFTSYITEYLGTLGANLTLTYKMGTSRTWTFTLSNTLF